MTPNMRPRIIVNSKDSDETFKWMSSGWHTVKNEHTDEAQDLMKKAQDAIAAGSDVPDTIRKLEEAGFEIVRTELN